MDEPETQPDALEDLRKRLGRTEYDRRMSDRHLWEEYHRRVLELQRFANEMSIRFDSFFVGADPSIHRADHDELAERRVRGRQLWRDIRNVSLVGIVIGAVVFFLLKNA